MNASPVLRRAFTLVEMLVVIIIITSILLIAVPSFQSMINSSQAALAESMLKSGLRAGKDAAMRSTGDQDSAVVFFYNPGGRLTMGIYVKVASLKDNHGGGDDVYRDIFVPTGVNEPVQLPRDWMVRGFAPPDGIDNGQALATNPFIEWYEDSTDRPMSPLDGNWVFPETHFYDTSTAGNGESRQTFMVRFEAGTGIVKPGAGATCLIFAPGTIDGWRNSGVYSSYRADQTDNPAKFVNRVINAPSNGAGALSDQDRQGLLGWQSSDMVLARPVSQLALYEESRLAAALGVRLDRTTDCIYKAIALTGSPTVDRPTYVDRPNAANFTRDVNRWIMGDTDLDGNYAEISGTSQAQDSPEARIYTIDRYTGGLQPVEVQ